MKIAFVATLLSASLLAVSPVVGDQTEKLDDSSLKDRFMEWMKQHDKGYENTKELIHRMHIWADNHRFIEEHNTKSPAPSYTLGHNHFSDLTIEEFREFNKLGKHSPGILKRHDVNRRSSPTVSVARRLRTVSDSPASVDWVKAGAVVPVKNQGMCGSCWAFSAICAIEGAHFLDTGDLVSLSEQELVDCDKLDAGCGGGLMDNAFLFDEDSPGICSEEDYPYAGHKHWFRGCAAKKGLCDGVDHTRVKSFVDIENTADGLAEAIATQPVSVAIEADQRTFQLYKDGVYNDPECGENLDHGVAAVGYGSTEAGDEYFLVRNSWGDTWGQDGYIMMGRTGSPNVNGTCGILGFASRPLLRDD
mmetsp:Transcript_23549/g.65765  ORF Transcript_23549/g.65765 Transcript_23549/m.65765 type:complete len:361 (-) Transcript_23549:1509-2591(-)|eukprot:CAMPEP_0198135068 /NCGR_PEP_ID=MMETSP1442-20131203/60402_1 /TAXON_ID= /ORGANISM="Craspedostauros australis, Strain CCMP3328" /LENGTH=360 /DNA_ID=CAMNT_0043796229 /DNA_START=64 /DNA_END=1146 /DNA_ORIENTATION=-